MDDSINSGSDNKLPLFVGIGAIAVAVLALALAVKAKSDAKALDLKLADAQATITSLQGEIGAVRNSAAKAADIAAVDAKVEEFKTAVTTNLNGVVEQLNAQKKVLEAVKTSPKATGTTGGTATVTAGPGEYVVKSGDTPRKIAASAGVSVTELLKANPGLDPKKMHVGQKLKLPAAGAPKAEAKPTAKK